MKRHLLLVLGLVTSLSTALAQREIDAVAEGKKVFENYGCAVCHAVEKGDKSQRTGPNLFGLFVNDPRERLVENSTNKKRIAVKADKNYFLTSVRKSWDVLAIAESGATKGEAYPQIMPMYSKEVIPDQAVEMIWHYVRTLADAGQAGPAVVKVKEAKKETPKNLLEIPNEVLVTKTPRVFRASLRGSSGRAIHVGLPNGMNYTFDPRTLSVRNVWGGGFLNLSTERSGRGRPGSVRGQGNRVFVQGLGIMRPLLPSGEPVDFEFKEPDVMDHKAIEKWLWEDRDFPELQASVDAEFLAYYFPRIYPQSARTGEPLFIYRVGKNRITQAFRLTDDGRVEIALAGSCKEPQKFKISTEGLSDISVKAGKLADGIWTMDIDQGKAAFGHVLSARLAGGLVARPPVGREEDRKPQPVVTHTNKIGRDQLFEPTGMAVAKDGTIVVATRTAGVWRIRDNQWSLFAEGTYECLGVWIEDDKGDKIVIMQKPEMTRLTDTDGSGRADQIETVCDDYGFHANYHEYAHGPATARNSIARTCYCWAKNRRPFSPAGRTN